MRKSKPCKNRVPMYEENPERRVHCPEWSIHLPHFEAIEHIAKKNDMSRSRVFETLMHNFFLIEKAKITEDKIVEVEVEKKVVRKLTLHPTLIELIKQFSNASEISSSKYINSALAIYFEKHKGEMDLRKLIALM